jgi:hypothetical protein
MCANISFVSVAGRTSLAVKVARYEKRAAAVKNPFRLRALRLDRNAKQSTKTKYFRGQSAFTRNRTLRQQAGVSGSLPIDAA